jgi:SAM-dependent methyltransferase
MDQTAILSLVPPKMRNTLLDAWSKCLLFKEKIRGIDTLEPVSLEDLHLDPIRSMEYNSSGNRFLQQVVNKLSITSKDAIFDFGCGKGGALVTLAKFPFWKLGGVELSPELHAIAKKNMSRLQMKNVELFCRDAGEITDLDDYTYLYFFNPFPAVVMEEVMKNAIASLRSRPRKLTIIYYNPVCHDTILKTGVFAKTTEYPGDYSGHPFFIYHSLD